MRPELFATGFAVLPHEPGLARWAAAAHAAGLEITADPAMRARWLRHGGTWFVGVDTLPNAPDGSVGGVPLTGAFRAIPALAGALHRAQLSVVLPGYPGRDPQDTDAAHRFRRDRDGAHLDGLLPEGPGRHRHLREPHAVILGLPLNPVGAGASPLVVWEGSPAIVRAAFARAFAGHRPEVWADLDLTGIYAAARARVFATCPRRVVTAGPGQAVLMHRMAIHGVAPWADGATAPPEGRMVAYFRPLCAHPADWMAPD